MLILDRVAIWLLQVEGNPPAESPPAGNGGAAQPPAGSLIDLLLPLIIVFFIFWLLVFRPESRKRKEREKKVQALKKGDQVITNGGILGKVSKVEDKYVLLQIDKEKDVRVRFLKSSVFEVLPAAEPEAVA